MKKKDKIKKTLREAAALLSGPSRWTTGSMGRTKDGGIVGALNEEAVSWCMLGALTKVVQDFPPDDCRNAIVKTFCSPGGDIVLLNDIRIGADKELSEKEKQELAVTVLLVAAQAHGDM